MSSSTDGRTPTVFMPGGVTHIDFTERITLSQVWCEYCRNCTYFIPGQVPPRKCLSCGAPLA